MSEAPAAVLQEPLATLEDQGVVWEMGDVSRGQYSVTIGYLRAFITMLVIANHAVMAYYPFAPAPQADFAAIRARVFAAMRRFSLPRAPTPAATLRSRPFAGDRADRGRS